MSATGNNRLTVLAGEIKEADGRCRRGAEAAAAAAIEAGHKLIEAKELLQHGEWLPWLREHAGISERTARRYMQLARSGMEIGHVADLGIAGAVESLSRRDRVIDQGIDAAIGFLQIAGEQPTPQDVAEFLARPDLEQIATALRDAADKRIDELLPAEGFYAPTAGECVKITRDGNTAYVWPSDRNAGFFEIMALDAEAPHGSVTTLRRPVTWEGVRLHLVQMGCEPAGAFIERLPSDNRDLEELRQQEVSGAAYDLGVPIESIIFDRKLYPRSEFDLEYVRELAEVVGDLPPIEINQHNVLIDGRYRLEAHKARGLKRIRVTMTEVPNDLEHKRLAARRNSSWGLRLSNEQVQEAEKRLAELKAREAGQ